MPQISNLSFNVSFEPHNPNRVGLINTTPDLPAGFVGIFKVTQPDGYVRNGDINTPDVTNVVSSCVITIVPDSAGQLQQGQYTIEFIGNAPGYLSTSFIRTFTFQYTPATISLRNDFDVFTPQLAYTDISNYNVSGYTISTGPTRRWDATSTTTGTISGTNSSIDIRYNNQYYAETYSIEFRVNVAYVSQAYPWLSITHTRTQTTSVTACIPKSLEDLTQAVEALREESNASCGGDWARFEKANSLYVHLINMLRLVLIAGEHQDGFFDVYQQLLSYIQNGSVACDSIGQVIPPYDFSDYESSIYDGQSSYCQLVGDGVNTVYRVNHQLGDECVVVQVYEVATGKQVFCDLAVSTINSIDITFYEPPTLNQYRVVAVAGALGLRGQGFQPGGLTGQILRKKTNADFDTEWADVTVALPLLVPYSGATQSVYLGEHGIETGYVRFDTTPTTTPAVPAVMSWNDQEGTVDLKLKGNNVTLQIGQEMVARVVNKTGANLLESQYKAVRIRKVSEGGAQGQRLAVVLAQGNTEFESTDMLGIVTENINNNEEGFITTFGTVRGINTTGSLQGENWVDGDILFVSPTVPGGLTKVKPSAPNHLIIVGYVEYAHANNGKIFVHVQTSWELDELHNVAISNPVNNQVLKYNGTLWENATFPAVTSVGLATATSGVTITDTPVTSSGVININIATASASSNGLLSSADWATFNAKQSALTFGNISTATSGVTITNGNASTVGPNVSISIATAGSGQNGLLSAADWATFNAKQSAITLTTTGNSGAATFVGSTLNIPNYTLAGLGGVPTTRSLTINGTAYDLSADRTWSVGTVTSVAALTIGTAGTDITSTVATGTTTPVITLNVPTASAANRGALSAADWTTFNAKVGGSGTINYVPKFTDAGSVGNSQIFDNGTSVGIGTASPNASYLVEAVKNGDVIFNLRTTSSTGNSYIRAQSTTTNLYSAGIAQSTGTSAPFVNDGAFQYTNGAGGMQIITGTATPIQFFTNNTERLRISASGDVGIGTSSFSAITNYTSLFLNSASSGTSVRLLTSNNNAAEFRYDISGAAFADIGTLASWPFLLKSAGVERMRIHTNGRIGVNTTTDAGYQLDVNGTLRSVNGANFATTSGKVGIGNTNTTGAKLEVTDASSFEIAKFNGTSTGSYITLSESGTDRAYIEWGLTNTSNPNGNYLGLYNAENGGRIRFATRQSGGTINSSALVIDENANVGIGTTSPANAKLVVEGTSAGTIGAIMSTDTSGTTSFLRILGDVASQNLINWQTGTSLRFATSTQAYGTFVERMRITDAGVITVANLAGSGERVVVADASGNLSATTLSSSVTTGSGTTNYVTKWTGASTQGDSQIFDNGTNVGIGTVSPAVKLEIAGSGTQQIRILSASGADMRMNADTVGRSGTYSISDYIILTNSSERVRITSGGNVGIGTGSPALKLHVVGDIGTTTRVATDLINGWTGGSTPLTIQTGGAQSLIFGTSATERLRIFANGRIGINTTTDAGYQLDVNGSMRSANGAQFATTAGNVGIGTTSPQVKLVVSNGGNLGLEIDPTNTSGTVVNMFAYDRVAAVYRTIALNSGGGDVAIGSTSASYKLDINGTLRSVNGANFATTSGNVGIGTTTAGAKLEVNLASGVNIITARGPEYAQVRHTDGVRTFFTQVYDNVGFIGMESNTPLAIGTNNTERLRITSGGDVGIGTSSPTERFHVSGGNVIVNTNQAFGWGDRTAQIVGQSGGSGFLRFDTNNAERLRITSGGDVGIGTTTPSLYSLAGYKYLTLSNTTSNQYAGIIAAGQGVGGGELLLGNQTVLHGIVGSINGSALAFYTNGANSGTSVSERLRIHANGRVGINTTTDAGYQLDVNGTLRTTAGANIATSGGTLVVGSAGASSWGSGTRSIQIGQGRFLSLWEGVNGTANSGFAVYEGTTANTYNYLTTGDAPTLYRQLGGVHSWHNAPSGTANAVITFSERMRITSSGELLINTTSDAGDYKLQVSGNIYNTGSAVLAANGTSHIGMGTVPSAWSWPNGVTQFRFGGHIAVADNSFLQLGTNSFYDGSNYVRVNAGYSSRYLQNDGGHFWSTAITSTAGSTVTFNEQMRMTRDGELLINTTSDAGDYKLQVAGNIYNTGSAVLAATSGNVGIGTTSPSSLGKVGIQTDGGTGAGVGIYSPSTTNGAKITLFDNINNAGIYGAPETLGTNLVFQTNSTEKLRIRFDGNVGIGTTGPSKKLVVAAPPPTFSGDDGITVIDPATANQTYLARCGSTYTYRGVPANAGMLYSNTDLSLLADSGYAITFHTSSGHVARLTAAGNFGIGTTSPDINSTGNRVLTISGAYTRARLQLQNTDNISTGVVGGSVEFLNGSNVIGLITGSTDATSTTAGHLTFHTGGTVERMRIFSNGRVAINTTTDAGYQLDVNGGTRVTGRVTVTGNDTLGLSITRAGTSAIASEIYNGGGDNGWLLYGVESSAGGVIFPGTTAYASVFGSFRNVPVQFATNNAVRMTIDGGGSVGIGVASPSASAILQVDSTTKGMLPPRMTTTQRDAITSPATGLIVYDTTVNKLSVYNGTTWKYAQYE